MKRYLLNERKGVETVLNGNLIFNLKILNLVPCSTVSGSGIDFFRKFVQRKGDGCRECEDRFRREVLIDRLVSDSLNTRAALSVSSAKGHGSISA